VNPAPPLHWVLSARDGRNGQDLRLHPQAPLHPDADATSHTRAPARLWVDTSRRFQRLEGFGGAFTEAAATTWLKLSPPRREAFCGPASTPGKGTATRCAACT
jgi:glucosylceramidase